MCESVQRRAYATLDRHPGHTFVAALLLRASDTLQFFSAQNISNTVWYAVLRGEERYTNSCQLDQAWAAGALAYSCISTATGQWRH